MKEEISTFLKESNTSLIALLEKLNVEAEEKEELRRKFHQQCLALLLDADILNAESYNSESNGVENGHRRHTDTEDSLIQRSNQMIKRLAKQVLEKDEEIQRLKGELLERH